MVLIFHKLKVCWLGISFQIFATLVAGRNAFSDSGAATRSAKERCFNLGSADEIIGPYVYEKGFVNYTFPRPESLEFAVKSISNTEHKRAFSVQAVGSKIAFSVSVDKHFNYNIKLGFAEMLNCEQKGVPMTVTVNRRTLSNVNVFKAAGCRKAHFLTFKNIVPSNGGGININIVGKGKVGMATMCTMQTERRVIFTTPSCKQRGCINVVARANYKVISASLLTKSCKRLRVASRILKLRKGSIIRSAILQWADDFSSKPKKTSIRINGIKVNSSSVKLYGGNSHGPYYFATADVTDIVKKTGTGRYTIGNLGHRRTASRTSCLPSAFSGWHLTVIFGHPSFPVTRINLCTNAVNVNYNRYGARMVVKCTLTLKQQKKSRGSLISFAGEPRYNEVVKVNAAEVVRNQFGGKRGIGMDVVNFGFTKYVRPTKSFTTIKVDSLGTLDYVFVVGQVASQVVKT